MNELQLRYKNGGYMARRPKRARIVSAFAVAILLSACVGGSTEDLLESANKYLLKHDSNSAIIQLKNILQTNPDSAEARFLLGKTLLDTGNSAAASAELKRALDLKYDTSKVLPLLVKSLLIGRQYQTIVDQYSGVSVTDNTSTADVKTMVADAYASLGDAANAQGSLKAALKAVPDYPPALIFEARTKADHRQFDEALEILEKVLAATPSGAEAWHFKGELLLFAKGDVPGAKASYEKALSIKPDYLSARYAIISLYLAQHDLPNAETQIAHLRKKLAKHPQTTYFEAQLAYLKEDNDKARELTQQLLKLAPDSPKVLQLAGAVAYNGRSLLQAETYLSKALQLMPDLPVARSLLARTQLRTGHPAKALEILKPSLAALVSDPEAFSLAGEAYLQLGDLALAQSNFARAAALNPQDTRSRTALAMSRMTDVNVDATFAELRSISAGNTDTYADLAMLSAYLRRKDVDNALKVVDAIEKKQPNAPLASNLRGQVLLLRNEPVLARTSFEGALAIDPAYVPAAASLADLDLRDDKPESARKRFEAVLVSDPRNLKALLALAGLRARAGGTKEDVTQMLASAVKLNPSEIAPRLLMIDKHLAAKDSQFGLTVAREAVIALPESLELLDALGRAQLAAGERNQAISSFIKLASLTPESPNAFLRLASAYTVDNNLPAAIQSLKRALDVQPNLLQAQRALVELHVAAKQPELALAVARMVQRQRQSDPSGYVLEGGIKSSQGKFVEASDAYRIALSKSPRSDIATKLHSVLGAQQKDTEAARFASTWLRTKPDDPAFLFYLGEVSLAKGDLQVAAGYFEHVAKVNPLHAFALNNLAWVNDKLNRPGAVGYARRANELVPNTPAFMDTLAAALASNNQIEEAIELQKRAVSLSANSALLRLALAKMYIQAGNKSSARAELTALTQVSGNSATSQAEASKLLQAL